MAEDQTPGAALDKAPPWWVLGLPYLVPFGVMLGLTAVADALPNSRVELYGTRVVVVCALLWVFRRHYPRLRPRLDGPTLVAALVGLGIIVFWIAADRWYPQSWAEWQTVFRHGWQLLPHPEKQLGGFDPYSSTGLLPPVLGIALRVFGAVVMVPLAEELFHRAWLLRFLIRDDIRRVPLGTYTFASFAWSCLLFGLSHHEWLAGIVCGALLNLLLYWRRNLWHCLVAHAMANLGLAVWVLTRQDWQFW